MARVTSSGLLDGSRVGVVGAGPAGSLFACFLARLAEQAGRTIQIEIHEPRDFATPGAVGCNMCGGIVSESLVQNLAAEGISLSADVVQRGIDSYVMHTEAGRVRIATPRHEMRIAAVHRGSGPRDLQGRRWRSLDGFLLDLAVERGVRRTTRKASGFDRVDGRPVVRFADGASETYDFLAIATGINAGALKLLGDSASGYRPPRAARTLIREYYLGDEGIARHLGSSMHVFLLNIPRLEFAAIIPKGDYATVCLLGEAIDKPLIDAFMRAPEVRSCFPADWDSELRSCQCSPWISTRGAPRPFGDRTVFLGDCGVSRLYKDGIGAAYRAAKSAAAAAIFHGVGKAELDRVYGAYCRRVESDNRYGRLTFGVTRLIQRVPAAHGVLNRTAAAEQLPGAGVPRLGMVLWDMFTGSQDYRTVFLRTLHPVFLLGLARGAIGHAGRDHGERPEDAAAAADREEGAVHTDGALGRVYQDGEVIVRQGDQGDALYVIQEGKVAVVAERGGKEVFLRELGPGDILGEMAVFDREVRSATVRAAGRARILTLDQEGLLRRFREDPTLAFHIMKTMSRRIRQLTAEVSRLQADE